MEAVMTYNIPKPPFSILDQMDRDRRLDEETDDDNEELDDDNEVDDEEGEEEE